MTTDYLWWQTGIIYQIYPRSYQDSNGDGIGDLAGIRQRLEYLEKLGVTAVWLSPIYPSPMHDFGYDVADYTAIHPMFGSMADFDALLADAHQRGLKLILDLVPNHTSDEHPGLWRAAAAATTRSATGTSGATPRPMAGPPNNWLSFFGGPAWSFDETTGQYYLHQFVRQQPELNYRHPDVLPAMLDAMRFWLDKGVDGFRVDVIWLMMKDELLRDEPAKPRLGWRGAVCQPATHLHAGFARVHDIIRQMRAVLDEYDARMMVGEIYLPFEELVTYYGRAHDECHLPVQLPPHQRPLVGNGRAPAGG
jgi:alpha-glucosidase